MQSLENRGVSHRDHLFRRFQRQVQAYVPAIIHLLDNQGWLNDTLIHEVRQRNERVLPDDVTLAGLQVTLEAAQLSVQPGHKVKGIAQWLLGFALDGADGALARHYNLASVDGAIKDVLADRIGENAIAEILARNYQSFSEAGDLETRLKQSFQLSTLTKAACEMTGVQTSEGGQGSMLERRRLLLFSLLNIGKINDLENKLRSVATSSPARPSKTDRARDKQEILRNAIDARNDQLITHSQQRAVERVKAIAAGIQSHQAGWNNPTLADSNSPAAIEARKYTAVVWMNQHMGIDMVRELNQLDPDVTFPSAESLTEKYPYIKESLSNIQWFVQEALAIVERVNPSV